MEQWLLNCKEHSYAQHDHVVPHGSYLVNLAQKDKEKSDQAYRAFVDDLLRCESLGIKLYNFHPGATGGHPRPEAIGRVAAALNKAHEETSSVVTLLENMAAGGNVLGSTFEDLRDMIEGVESKHRVGVCLDTAHSFAAGYDLRSPEAFKKTLEEFDSTVGLKYLRALHLNDSKAPFDARRDLHANIGTGFLGLRAFHNIMNEPRLRRLPMVLETPIDRKDENGREQQDKGIWAAEIKLLESLVGMDPDGKEFKRLEAELWERGKAERDRVQEQVDRRDEKKAKKEAKDKDKGKGKGMGRGAKGKKADAQTSERSTGSSGSSSLSSVGSSGSDREAS